MHQIDTPVDYQRHTPKLTNIAMLKVCFVDNTIWNDWWDNHIILQQTSIML